VTELLKQYITEAVGFEEEALGGEEDKDKDFGDFFDDVGDEYW
jgi:hypothetical protein